MRRKPEPPPTVKRRRAEPPPAAWPPADDPGAALSRAQRRAALALECVGEVRALRAPDGNADAALRAAYDARVAVLPVLLRTNGLLQTVAFLLAEAEATPSRAEWRLVRHLERFLDAAGLLPADDASRTPDEHVAWLCQALSGADYADYARMQAEARAAAGWLRQLTRGLPGEPTDDEP